jgi:hypothetical protein
MQFGDTADYKSALQRFARRSRFGGSFEMRLTADEKQRSTMG